MSYGRHTLVAAFLVAWFTSSATVNAAKDLTSSAISATTALGTADGDTLHVKLSIAISDNDSPELSNAAGETYYKVGSGYYPHSNANNVGTLSVTPSWVESGAAQKFADANSSNGSVQFTFTGTYDSTEDSPTGITGVVLKNATSAADTNMATSNQITITVTVDATNGNLAADPSTIYFAARPRYSATTGTDADTFTETGTGTGLMDISSCFTLA